MTLQEVQCNCYHILYPTRQLLDISPFQPLDFELLPLDLNPAHGEVLKMELIEGITLEPDSRYVLSPKMLRKIAEIAGILFDEQTTRRIGVSTNSQISEYQATGVIR